MALTTITGRSQYMPEEVALNRPTDVFKKDAIRVQDALAETWLIRWSRDDWDVLADVSVGPPNPRFASQSWGAFIEIRTSMYGGDTVRQSVGFGHGGSLVVVGNVVEADICWNPDVVKWAGAANYGKYSVGAGPLRGLDTPRTTFSSIFPRQLPAGNILVRPIPPRAKRLRVCCDNGTLSWRVRFLAMGPAGPGAGLDEIMDFQGGTVTINNSVDVPPEACAYSIENTGGAALLFLNTWFEQE